MPALFSVPVELVEPTPDSSPVLPNPPFGCRACLKRRQVTWTREKKLSAEMLLEAKRKSCLFSLGLLRGWDTEWSCYHKDKEQN